MVRGGTLTVSEDPRELDDAGHSRHEQLLHRELGRRVKVQGARRVCERILDLGTEGAQVRLQARRDLQGRRLHLDEPAAAKPVSDRRGHAGARLQARPPCGEAVGMPPGGRVHRHSIAGP